MEENKAIRNRYDFVVLFDVENGNPNGDPDAGNMPRVDPETGLGLVTDVCLKRKIRNYVEAAKEDQPGYQIYVRETVPLEANDKKALEYLGVDDVKKIDKKKDPDADRKIRDFMCSNFYDIRTFGAVMTTFVKGALSCGQVRGPVQLGFAHSIDPIMPQEITITRVAITTAKRQEEGRNTEMGRKYIVPYGLYRVEGYVSANLARKSTGFSDEDLQLLWKAIINMFENDHSAARGNMAVRELIVFKHESELGNAPSYKLFERVQVAKKDPRKAPRSYHDYQVTVDTENLPEGITCQRMV
ncbi:type I-C CRISPR-associated protein Cas7/Csd2 [Acidaminococcus sp. DS4831]|uniref:type I-C CRISPR-associated protein Cas7/Csd2 n=1 Tax=Acidaminococcus sp. DS4831 TaxID=3141399 RepID=UPI0032E43E82